MNPAFSPHRQAAVAGRVAMVLVLLAPLAACDNSTAPAVPGPTTEFITQRRAWLPGERDSAIARIQRSRLLALPWVGDLSDNAGQLLALDSTTDIVPNPDYAAPGGASPFGPTYSLRGVRTPGTGWTTVGLDIQIVNNNQGGDTFNWLGALWYSNADSTWKGIILANGAGTSLPATTVNTPAFDAANAKSGAGGGEFRFSDGTFWQANGTGAPNQFSVGFSFFFGGTTTITTGPYLGGTSRTGIMSITINNVGLSCVAPAGACSPLNQTASLSGWVGAAQLTCIFPTPCTTNVPAVAAARPADDGLTDVSAASANGRDRDAGVANESFPWGER